MIIFIKKSAPFGLHKWQASKEIDGTKVVFAGKTCTPAVYFQAFNHFFLSYLADDGTDNTKIEKKTHSFS